MWRFWERGRKNREKKNRAKKGWSWLGFREKVGARGHSDYGRRYS